MGVSAPAQTSAVYSPSESPAATAGSVVPAWPKASRREMSAATLAAKMAGCALHVRVSSFSGPSKQRRARSIPAALLAASIHSRTAGEAS